MTPAFRYTLLWLIPQQFKLRWEVQTPEGQIYPRLYEIERAP